MRCPSVLRVAAVAGALGPGPLADPAIEVARRLVDETGPVVSEIRRLEFQRPVSVEIVDDDLARSYLLQRLEEFDVHEQLRSAQAAYELLGLIEPGTDILESLLATLREQAGGFYDPTRKTLYLLDDMPPELAPALVAHELTHALEDQHFDLDRRLRETIEDDDRSFAMAAVHEGSAMLVMTQFVARQLLSGKIDLEQLQEFERRSSAGPELLGLPPVLQRQLLGPYLLGPTFLSRSGDAGPTGYSAQGVDLVYRDGPASSEQILHPEKYWDATRRDLPQAVSLGDSAVPLGPGWGLRGSGVLGELSAAVVVGAPTPLDPARLIHEGAALWTHPAAAGWGGDRWELWQRGEERVLLWLTLWDTRNDATEFARAIAKRQSRMARAKERVAVVAGPVPRRTARRVLDAMLARRR